MLCEAHRYGEIAGIAPEDEAAKYLIWVLTLKGPEREELSHKCKAYVIEHGLLGKSARAP